MNIQLLGKDTTYASLRQEVLDMCEHYVGNLSTPMDTMMLEEKPESKGWSDKEVYSWMEEQGLDIDA